jgi:eukaryotic-like serine/threonine-protein kinase
MLAGEGRSHVHARGEDEMTADGDQYVGATIAGKYKIRRLIGVGGMGSVYEGQHVDLGKKVAVKILDSVADTSAELATRFRREARAASAVESEGIVQVFDVGRDPDIGLYMVMELLHGEDLEMRLRKQPGRRLDPIVVAQIGHQVARALVKAHAARVIHRDLKPANIFLTDRDDGSLRVKILDFGVSKLLASEASIATSKERLLELTAAGVALGTPQYMAPEQAQGLTTVDHRADVWGLGVVLYEALAGIPAYPELRTYQETIINLLQVPPQPLHKVAPWVPEALAKVVHEALVHDVNARIQDCATFAARIGEALPELVMASTGPFGAAHQLLRMTSSPSHVAYRPPPAAPVVPAAPHSAPPSSASRPITLSDDTQVVVRPSDPASFDETDPSTTMLADSRRAPGEGEPKVEVLNSSKPGAPSRDDAPASSGDPTMFQGPAWVESHGEGPATLKTGLSIAEAPTVPPRRANQALTAGLVSALIVVIVGGGALLLARAAGTNGDAAGAALPVTAAPSVPAAPLVTVAPSVAVEAPTAESTAASATGSVPSAAALPALTVAAPSAVATAEPSPNSAATTIVAAPPATGTGAIPLAPATGVAVAASPPAAEAKVDASDTAAAADSAR